ncbi:hypothetical protein M407DRAFT_19077 [Tulasnella calospora MUT 4182]|uniref:ZZ-type domain-containing protein n=1 Tax=Tulasnella calospora MUT 4182 TaxID=1051891 RepID=A0A0C3QIT4_9AGAM|nr:hypothetical protein M407DRAFT_19077 [Tulasnella calospora MUT 4182]
MSSEYGGSSFSDMPDRPLIVKCFFDRSLKRISFASAVNCTFERLRQKVEQSFSLSACLFTISYTDDDGETTAIANDYDLLEAIQYFQAGDDVPSSAASAASGRSGMGRRITLRVQVAVDYDGPSLSDTSSLASMEEYRHGGSSHSPPSIDSFRGGSISGFSEELDEETRTVLSFGPVVSATSPPQHLPMPPGYRLPGHSVPSVATSPPSPPLSDPLDLETQSQQSQSGNRSVRFDERRGAPRLGSEISFSSAPPNREQLSAGGSSPASHGRTTEFSTTPTAVFQQLKLSDQSSRSSAAGSSVGGPSAFTQNSRKVQWLQEQNARSLRTMIGEAAPSSSSDTSSLLFEEGVVGQASTGMQGDLALEQDLRGRFYYAYTSDSQSGYMQSDDMDEPGSALDRRISTSSQNLAWLRNHRAAPGRPSSMSLRMTAAQFQASSKGMSVPNKTAASAYERTLPNDLGELALDDLELSAIPPEVLPFLDPASDTFTPPTMVTDCSCCGVELDTFRYICSICGEKTAHPKGENPFANDHSVSDEGHGELDPKGKGKAYASRLSDDNTRSPTGPQHSATYPPLSQIPGYQQLPSPSPASSLTFLNEPEPMRSPLAALSSLFRSKPRGFRKVESKASLPCSSGSERSNLSVLSLPETAVNSGSISPTSPRSERQRSITSAFEQGYELCSSCIYTAGVSHAYEATLATPSGSSNGSIGSTLSLHSSPSSPDETESSLRRSAPAQKGRTRHAFIENVWDGSAWTAIGASCPSFNLCRGCYSQVHEIHPAHVFLSVPSKPKAPTPSPTSPTKPNRESTIDEQSLKHPDVSCFNCGLDILGARFHCAVCESVDICQNCESAGLPGNLTTNTEGGHDSSHIMIKIPYPLDSAEVAIASRRARVLWSERDAATIDATTKRITPRSRSNSVDSSYATTVVATGRREPNLLDHHVKCNGCNINIVGPRYQCANCPSYPVSYNLCAECERSSFVIHPFPHVFLKFNRRVDHPVQTPHPLLPVLYEIPADGDFMDSIGNAANYVHEIAYCDLCMTPIRGVWYRCGHCNSDLCDFHEHTHNEDHSFIVIKAKASLGVLQDLWDFENPSSNAPLLQPVFNPRQ